MREEECYQNFVDWLGRTWWGLTPSEVLMPLMKARYTVEEAAFLTGIPHAATSLEDLAELKGVEASALEPQLKKMCQRGLMYEIKRGASIRQRQILDDNGNDCDKPLSVCLHFDELGRYIVDNGMGREITRAETEKILKESADAGLVHGISNWQEKPDTILNCCS